MCPVPKSPESRLSSRNSGTSYKLTSAGGQAGCRTSNPRHPRDSGRRSRGRGRTSPRNATFRGKSLRCSTARVPATPNRSHHRTPSGNRPVSYLLYIWPFHRAKPGRNGAATTNGGCSTPNVRSTRYTCCLRCRRRPRPTTRPPEAHRKAKPPLRV